MNRATIGKRPRLRRINLSTPFRRGGKEGGGREFRGAVPLLEAGFAAFALSRERNLPCGERRKTRRCPQHRLNR